MCRVIGYRYIVFENFESFLLNLFLSLLSQSDAVFTLQIQYSLACLNYIRDFEQLMKNERQGVNCCEDKQKLVDKTIKEAVKCWHCWFSFTMMVGVRIHLTKR